MKIYLILLKYLKIQFKTFYQTYRMQKTLKKKKKKKKKKTEHGLRWAAA